MPRSSSGFASRPADDTGNAFAGMTPTTGRGRDSGFGTRWWCAPPLPPAVTPCGAKTCRTGCGLRRFGWSIRWRERRPRCKLPPAVWRVLGQVEPRVLARDAAPAPGPGPAPVRRSRLTLKPSLGRNVRGTAGPTQPRRRPRKPTTAPHGRAPPGPQGQLAGFVRTRVRRHSGLAGPHFGNYTLRLTAALTNARARPTIANRRQAP